MEEQVCLNFNGKRIKLNLKVCNFFERFSGLMFCRRKNAKALLFDFKKPTRVRLHSFFVFFPFLVIWLDDQNKVVDVEFVNSLRSSIFCRKPFSKIIEIPFNEKYKKIVSLVGRKV